MSDKPDSSHTLGLELFARSLRGAQLSFVKGKPQLIRIFETELDTTQNSADHVNPLYMTKQGKQLSTLLKTNLIVTTLPTQEVLIRPLEIKLKKLKDIDAVLPFQIEPLLPYPLEKALLDRIVLSQNKEGSTLSVIATRKDFIHNHLENWRTLEIEPEVISCVPVAIAAFANYFNSSKNPYLVLHLGETTTTGILVRDGKLIASQACTNGISNLHAAYIADCGDNHPDSFSQFSFAELDSVAYPHLTRAIENLRLEITRVIYALGKHAKGQETNDILILGDGCEYKDLPQKLLKDLEKTIHSPNPNPNFTLSITQLQKYAIAIGAALTALPKHPDPVNFRQNEFQYPNPWKRFKRPLTIYALLCLLVAFSFYIFGETYLAYQTDTLRQDYLDLLSAANKPYKEFEKSFSKSFYKNKSDDDEVLLSPIQLNPHDILQRTEALEKELRSTPDLFPLYPNVPRVSDVLAWLSQHPKVVGKEENSDAILPLIQIESFNYIMLKRPDQTKRQEKYQVKVEIEFTSPTPKQAREFHDALIAPNEIVDPKGEIKWNTNRGKYRASFFLKDKTFYPSMTK